MGKLTKMYPPASKVSWEVANFIERKKNTPNCIFCQRFVYLSGSNLDLNYLRTGKIDQHLPSHLPQPLYLGPQPKTTTRADREPTIKNKDINYFVCVFQEHSLMLHVEIYAMFYCTMSCSSRDTESKTLCSFIQKISSQTQSLASLSYQ